MNFPIFKRWIVKNKNNFIFFWFYNKNLKLRGDLKIMENKELKERFIDERTGIEYVRLLYSKFSSTKTKENTFE